MADESVIYCPLCGNKVPVGVAKCPVCATALQQVIARRSTEKAATERVADDFLHREIPKVILPETKHTCPLCALELTGTEARCPRCGVPLTPSKEEMLECPECGALAPADSQSCPSCGVGFEETPALPGPPVEELPPPPRPVRPEPVPQRPSPEVVTTIATPSRPPVQGMVNGRGAINGTGLVNGTGMINGTKGEIRLGVTKKQRLFITRWQFLAVLIALVIVIPTFIYLSYSEETVPFNVDGNFDDWAHSQMFGTYVKSGASAININEWAINSVDTRLFVYVNVEGTIMSSSDVSSFYLFVDSDNSPSTGYSVSGIGAEYLLQLDGWNGSVQSTAVSEYDSTDIFDWNSWQSIGSLSSAVSGSQLEAMAELPVAVSSTARFMLMSQNSQEEKSVSYTVPSKGGLLAVRLEPGPGVQSPGLILPSSSVAMLRLNLTCEGAKGTIRSIVPDVFGATLVSVVQDISLNPGDERVVDVQIDAGAATAGSLVSISLIASDIDSTFADVQIIGEGTSAYVTSPPSAIVIDGAFADWAGKTAADSDAVPNANPNIDISAVGAVNDSVMSAFYVSVVGQMCSGSYVPIIKEKPSGGGGGTVFPTRKTGEDFLRIYIDSDMNNATGYPMTLASKFIGADRLLEVRGLDGEISSRSLMSYSAVTGDWIYGSGTISAANDAQRLEISVSSISLGGASSIDFIIETTDWRQRTDLATAVPQGTKAIPGGILSGGSIESWIVDGTTTSSSATAMSYQRKVFYDGTNYWSFYFDGANTVYKYSTDFGQTWTAGGQAFTTAAIDKVSVWYDSNTRTLYIIGDHATASTTVHVRKGVVAAATHTITWSGADAQPTVSATPLGGKNTYISLDSSGYLWLMSSNRTQGGPVRYDLSVFRSVLVNSTTTWRHSGNMIGGSGDPTPGVKGSVVGIGSGTTILAVYGYSGNVSARTYTSSWSAATQIYAIGNDNPSNTDNAPPCVVVDGRGVAHVVYGDGHEQPLISKPKIYYVFYNGAWSVPYRLDIMSNQQGNLYPTISVDSATGNLFAFWIETLTDGVGYTVIAKKNITGTWTFWPLGGDTNYEKQYLTSIYSAPNEQLICWQWTQNATGSIQVHFDKIPEFAGVALPMFGMIAVFVVIYRRGFERRKKSTDD